MSHLIIALLLFSVPLIAGLAGMFLLEKVAKLNKYLLTFSGAFLLCITVMHILPDVFKTDIEYIGLFVLAGFFIQILLGHFSGGVEHGHAHIHEAVSPALYISLILHSLIEGTAITDTHTHHHLSEQLTLGVVIHKAPIAVALAGILKATTTKGKSYALLAVFCLASPLAYLGGPYLNEMTHTDIRYYALALAVGVFLHVSTIILFESEKGHRFDWPKALSMLAGVLVACLTFI